MTRHFGALNGVEEGAWFEDRAALHAAGVHKPTQHGISGSASEGADSIVLSGGYEDDEDEGERLLYTGFGGRDPSSGKQIADQMLERQNMALAVSCDRGLPIRVVRGAKHKSKWSPKSGYSYAGLFQVDRWYHQPGTSGYRVYRFAMSKLPSPKEGGGTMTPLPRGKEVPNLKEVTTLRVVRDSKVGRHVKALHEYQCQVCGHTLICPTGGYAEAAHIRPLGGEHRGADVPENVLCLCPNCHVLFDKGALEISDELTVSGAVSTELRTLTGHDIGREYLAYHRSHISEVQRDPRGSSIDNKG